MREMLADARTGKNGRHALVGLLRQASALVAVYDIAMTDCVLPNEDHAGVDRIPPLDAFEAIGDAVLVAAYLELEAFSAH